jgi:cytochrome P450
VQEVLARDDVFDVTYAEKMSLITDGQNFFLGMPDSPRYAQDVSNMRIVARRDDIPTMVAPVVTQAAEQIVSNSHRALDVVSGLTQLVPARFITKYLGTQCASESDFIGWATTLFWYLFLDPENEPGLSGRAMAASAALNAAVDRSIAERKARPSTVEDVLNRSLRLQSAGTPGMSDLDIRNNFVGLIIGAIPTTATAAALALDELLRRPNQLAGAAAAAQAGDDTRLAAFVFEALRFNPVSPAMYRRANRNFSLAAGEDHETIIPANTTVLVATQSAMFDERYIHNPEEFRIDRSPRDFLQFGYGLHACFGQHINQVQIPRILMPLLRHKNLRRADGIAGQYQKAGPFAGSLTVRFD